MTDRRTYDIGSRLENWARCYRTQRPIEVSPTGKFCDQLRREKEGDSATGERRKPDEVDARVIEDAMRHITDRERKMLVYCYIEGYRPEKVCRLLGLSPYPALVFINAFRQAQAAVEAVSKCDENFHDA